MEIKIEKFIELDWKKVKLIQPDNFKRMTLVQKNKLKRSLIEKGFKTPFIVTYIKKELICLDGHMRIPVLKELEKEGYDIPGKLPAIVIKCKDMQEAKETVLILNSRYGDIFKEGYSEWVKDIDINDIVPYVNIDIKDFKKGEETEVAVENMELKSFEHYDYLIFYFKNYNDFLAACHKFNVKKYNYNFSEKNKKIGIGRVLDGKKLL